MATRVIYILCIMLVCGCAVNPKPHYTVGNYQPRADGPANVEVRQDIYRRCAADASGLNLSLDEEATMMKVCMWKNGYTFEEANQ